MLGCRAGGAAAFGGDDMGARRSQSFGRNDGRSESFGRDEGRFGGRQEREAPVMRPGANTAWIVCDSCQSRDLSSGI